MTEVTYKCRQVGLEHSFWARSPWVFFPGAAHLWVRSAVSPFTLRVDSQSALLSSLPSAPPQPRACQRSPWCLSGFVLTRPAGHRAQVTGLQLLHTQDPLWALWRQLRPWPGPAPARVHSQGQTPPSLGSACRLFGCSACAEFTELVEEV